MNSEKAYYERLEIQNKILEDKYKQVLEVEQERFYRINKAIEYIEEKDLKNNMNFMDDGVGDLFKDILDILTGGKDE